MSSDISVMHVNSAADQIDAVACFTKFIAVRGGPGFMLCNHDECSLEGC